MSQRQDLTEISKFLSLVLRHKPETIGLILDDQGWASVDELLRLCAASGRNIDWETLMRVVAESDKQRFALSDDQARIRANQGHSLAIDLKLEPRQPPDILYHGTATRLLDSIRAQGLHRSERQHVHLSTNADIAVEVGKRHGRPVVLVVAAGKMHATGEKFYLAENGVWLTLRVPVEFIAFPTPGRSLLPEREET